MTLKPHIKDLNTQQVFEHLLFNLQFCNFGFAQHIVEGGVKIYNCACVLRLYEEAGSVQVFAQLSEIYDHANDFARKK